MHDIPFRKYIFSTAYKNLASCGNITIKKSVRNLETYIVVKKSSNITINSHIIVILKCIFKEFGYNRTKIVYSNDDTFCGTKQINVMNGLIVYVNELSKANVYTNSDSGYKSGIMSIEAAPPCAFSSNGRGNILVSLNIVGKIYEYNSYDKEGKRVTKYGQYVTFLNKTNMQDEFLASSSDSSNIDMKPFIEVSMQTDTGFSYFSKKSFSIKDVLYDLIHSINFLVDIPLWFKTRAKLTTMLPVHRYTSEDIKPQISGYYTYKGF
ncbi:Hypothetical protein SRAE_2000412700 [Strongyloides ratti]|uniref:Uncharacterized protein n=1 Tax=Strongyloides ratti TaxID=34506 RepID=A0A090LMT4_STRRB|nr:Hypothetical protein SRAE_2000412700 [Strongyloides ratti]CEF69478.1 Hypothetical protein SRAE_2000412700 [Strongyloides ratti]